MHRGVNTIYIIKIVFIFYHGKCINYALRSFLIGLHDGGERILRGIFSQLDKVMNVLKFKMLKE